MKRAFWGTMLILVGAAAMAQTLGFIQLKLSFWPVVGAVVGLSIVWDSMLGRRAPQWFGLFLGLWIAGMGIFAIAYDAGLTTISGRDIAGAGWPLLLIAIGVSIVFGKGFVFRINRHRNREGMECRSQVVGDMRFGGSHWVLDKDLDLDHNVGDLKVDLTTADITPGVHRITVNQFVGETVIKVPDNVSVRVTAEANVGELILFGDKRGGVGLNLERAIILPDAEAELIIDARLRVGALKVIRLPAVTRVIE